MKEGKEVYNELFNFEGFSFRQISKENTVIIHLKKGRKTGTCPLCNKTRRKVVEVRKRTIRDKNVADEKCYITLNVYRIICKGCFRGMEKLDFILPGERFTKRFSDYIYKKCKKMNLKDVGEDALIDWRTAKKIDKKILQEEFKDLSNCHPTGIGIDEVAYEKGHKYLTIVRDIDKGVIWVGRKRKKETLDKFFNELGKEKSKRIIVAVMDMWDPYIASVKEHTNADIVFDKFHIAKKINDAMDEIRKEEYKNASPEMRKLMKRKRFLFLHREDNLKRDQKTKLSELMKENERLYKAYLLKEEALLIFQRRQRNVAVKRLEEWKEKVLETDFEAFHKVLKTLDRYWYGIENYFTHHVTNGASEGYNNKINIIKRRAYGLKDLEYFRLKILQNCSKS